MADLVWTWVQTHPWQFVWQIVQVLLAFMTFLFLLPLFPGAIHSLTNNPNYNRPEGENNRTYDPSEFGFFTYLEPGRFKIIESGGRFIRGIMYYARRRFKGDTDTNDLTPRDPDFWERTDAKDGERDSHPLPFPTTWKKGTARTVWYFYAPFSILWWLWTRWVYVITGAVWTGPYPFRYVRTYPIPHYKQITGTDGETRLIRIENYSDHYRVADFQFPVEIPSADTSDFFAVRVLINVIARVINPYLTAYNTDDEWTLRLINSITDGVTHFTRSHALSVVLAANEGQATAFIDTVADNARQKLRDIGIEIIRVEIIDLSPTDQKVANRLADEAFAEVDRRAAELRAKGNAAAIREQGKALAEHPEALVSVGAEAQVRTAEAMSKNSGNFTILSGGTGTGGFMEQMVPIIAELRKMRSGTGQDNNPPKEGENA